MSERPSTSTSTSSTAADPSAQARTERLRHYLEADPGNLALQSELCDALLDAGQTQDALAVLEPALDARPDHAGLRYRQGVVQRRLAQFEAAKATLAALLQDGAAAPAVLYELACVHMLLSEPAPAAALLAQLAKAADYDASFPDADFFLLRCLHQTAQVKEALAHGAALLARGTSDPRVLGAMATLYIDDEQIEEAGKLLRSVAAQLPQDLAAPVQAELESAGGFVALNAEDMALARRHFEASLKSDAQFGRSLLGLGLVHAVSGKLVQAQQLLQQTVQAMPSHLGSWHTLGWMQLAQDDIDGAEHNFAHALALDPTFGESHGGMALIAALRGEHEQARELCRTALRLDKNSMNVLAAQLVMQHGSLKSPEILKTALPLLAKRPGLNNSSLQDTLTRLSQRQR